MTEVVQMKKQRKNEMYVQMSLTWYGMVPYSLNFLESFPERIS